MGTSNKDDHIHGPKKRRVSVAMNVTSMISPTSLNGSEHSERIIQFDATREKAASVEAGHAEHKSSKRG